jgi:uncharacterized membrane protein
MRSKAHFLGDPIHPAIVHFPIAFLIGGTVMDVCGIVYDCPPWWTGATYALIAGGIVTALVAAIPGFIDYFFTVPPATLAKRRATRHMIVNLVAVVFFAAALFLRGDPEIQPEHVLVAVEAVGALLIMYSGWLGGRLVSKDHIGVEDAPVG